MGTCSTSCSPGTNVPSATSPWGLIPALTAALEQGYDIDTLALLLSAVLLCRQGNKQDLSALVSDLLGLLHEEYSEMWGWKPFKISLNLHLSFSMAFLTATTSVCMFPSFEPTYRSKDEHWLSKRKRQCPLPLPPLVLPGKERSWGLVGAVGIRQREEAVLAWVVVEGRGILEVGWPCPIVILATGFLFTLTEVWVKLPWKPSPTPHLPTMRRSCSKWPSPISEMCESSTKLCAAGLGTYTYAWFAALLLAHGKYDMIDNHPTSRGVPFSEGNLFTMASVCSLSVCINKPPV